MAWNKEWDDVFASKPWGKYPSEELIRFIAKNFYSSRNRKKIKILELGCGTGSNLWYLSREGFSIYGIDGSKIAVEKSVERINREVPSWSGSIKIGDFSKKLAFDDETFDAIIDVQAISCNDLTSSLQIYKECKRVLKKDGLIFTKMFSSICLDSSTSLFIAPKDGIFSNMGKIRFTSMKDAKTLMEVYETLSIESLTRARFHPNHELVEEYIFIGKKND
jgi:SAM-dependent methyltransferase